MECANKCHNGFISADDLKELERYRIHIGLERHFADKILEEEKQLSVKKIVELPRNAEEVITDTKNAILLNNWDSILSAFEKLKVWREKIENDVLNQSYYQLKAIIEPEKYIDEIGTVSDDYWGVFWSYVAYMKVAKSKAEGVLTELTKWDTHYPIENQPLLRAVGYLMVDQEAEATRVFETISIGFSKELEPIYDALKELIGKTWLSITDDVSPQIKFYVDSLFKKTYESLKSRAKKSDADRLAEEAKRKQQEIADRDRQSKFITELKSNGGNIELARDATGMSPEVFIAMVQKYPDFETKIQGVKSAIKALREQAQLEAERDATLKRELADKKEKFKKRFETNECDLLKTCTELGLDSGTVQQWRRDDSSFGEALEYIERLHTDLVQQEKKRECRKQLKKILPWLLIVILFFVCILGIINLRHKKELIKAEQSQIELQQQAVAKYESRIIDFKQALETANNSNVDALGVASEIFVEIRTMENTEALSGRNESTKLRIDFNAKADAIMRDLQIFIAESERISSSDTEGARMLAQEEDNYRKVKEYKNIVAK